MLCKINNDRNINNFIIKHSDVYDFLLFHNIFIQRKLRKATHYQKKTAKAMREIAFMTKTYSDCIFLSRIAKKRFTSLLSSFCRWRLGNQMSAFATGYTLWRRFGIRNFLVGDQFDMLRDVFDLPIPKEKHVSEWPYYVWSESMA